MSDPTKGTLSIREAARRGGQQTAATHDHAFYVEAGRKGGEATARTHGPGFFSEIGRAGGRKRAALIEAGKREREEGREDG